MYYITSSSSVSHQPTFRNKSFSKSISTLADGSSLIRPDYKESINSDMLRRMSEIIRMSISCALDCLMQSEIKQPEGIIVGSGLGCLYDTEKFLSNIINIKKGLIPPTSFIQSTHNAIAGQISLVLGNHNYNMTHTQNTISFEHALLDACLNLDEGKENILVGGADEYIKPLNAIANQLGYDNVLLTSGASFFVIAKKKKEKSRILIRSTKTFGLINSLTDCVDEFLEENKLDIK
ncbi:MAG: beta-ketoacyl synthase chain length factor, partial [Bacteroidia bacterium]|nr:beta-ketoacyl synthase chain length factor [Bacteroidia bacterium]